MELHSDNDMSLNSSEKTEENKVEDFEMCTIEEYFLDSCRYNDREGVDQCFQTKFDIFTVDSNILIIYGFIY